MKKSTALEQVSIIGIPGIFQGRFFTLVFEPAENPKVAFYELSMKKKLPTTTTTTNKQKTYNIALSLRFTRRMLIMTADIREHFIEDIVLN